MPLFAHFEANFAGMRFLGLSSYGYCCAYANLDRYFLLKCSAGRMGIQEAKKIVTEKQIQTRACHLQYHDDQMRSAAASPDAIVETELAVFAAAAPVVSLADFVFAGNYASVAAVAGSEENQNYQCCGYNFAGLVAGVIAEIGTASAVE
jgi:hypothetical protein